uniref:Uncharacterized protein n=1 Tax=Xiphophorus maculatus TaxID=8083 RepID=A0A3B5R1A8_XIPMA
SAGLCGFQQAPQRLPDGPSQDGAYCENSHLCLKDFGNLCLFYNRGFQNNSIEEKTVLIWDIRPENGLLLLFVNWTPI